MTGWGGETTLDVEWSHSMAPGANILLVETPVSETEGTAGFPQIVKAENYVINHHLGQVISQSFGATEPTFPSPASILRRCAARTSTRSKNHVTVLAATGDAGATDYSNAAGTVLYTHPARRPARLPTRWSPRWAAPSCPLLSTGQRTSGGPGVGRQHQLPPGTTSSSAAPVRRALATGGGVSTVFARPWYQDSVALASSASSAACRTSR